MGVERLALANPDGRRGVPGAGPEFVDGMMAEATTWKGSPQRLNLRTAVGDQKADP
jgi:hypothetical protein